MNTHAIVALSLEICMDLFTGGCGQWMSKLQQVLGDVHFLQEVPNGLLDVGLPDG